MNKKENPGVSRRGAAMLLLFSLAVSVLLGFAMPVHAADDGRTTLRTLRVGFYPYTGYMATAADGSRSGYAYELLQDIAQHENVTFTYSCLNGNTQQAMQQLAAGQIDLIPVLRRTAERDEQFAFSAEPIGTVATMLTVKAGNRSIVAGDYDTFDGITVGTFLSGTGVCLDDGAEVPVGPGLCHYCPRGHSHSVVNTGTEPLVILGIVPNAK